MIKDADFDIGVFFKCFLKSLQDFSLALYCLYGQGNLNVQNSNGFN
jgi:hypothetical protein